MTPFRTLILTLPTFITVKYWLTDVGVIDEGLDHNPQDKSYARFGPGASIKQISRFYKLSRNTVRKYLRKDEQAMKAAKEASQRRKALDTYRTYLIGLLIKHSNLKTPKVLRKLKAKVPDLNVSERYAVKPGRSCNDPLCRGWIVDSVEVRT